MIQSDPIIVDLLNSGGLEHVNATLRTAMTNENAAPEALPPRLRAFLANHAKLPDGVDRARMERATGFFVDHGLSIAALLGLASLLECYAAKKGVKALHATDHMGYSGAGETRGRNRAVAVASRDDAQQALRGRNLHRGAVESANDARRESSADPDNCPTGTKKKTACRSIKKTCWLRCSPSASHRWFICRSSASPSRPRAPKDFCISGA